MNIIPYNTLSSIICRELYKRTHFNLTIYGMTNSGEFLYYLYRGLFIPPKGKVFAFYAESRHICNEILYKLYEDT